MTKEERILAIAANLMSSKGYDGTSFQNIADKVGLHKSTLFHYFKSKEEMLRRILEESMNEVNMRLEEVVADSQLAPEEKLRTAMKNHVKLLTKYSDNVNVYLNEIRSLSRQNRNLYIAKRKKYEKNFQNIIAEMGKKGYFSGCDPKVTTFGILGMLNWVAKWYKKDRSLSAEEIADTFYKIILPSR